LPSRTGTSRRLFVAGIIDLSACDGQGNISLADALVLGLDDTDPNPTNGKQLAAKSLEVSSFSCLPLEGAGKPAPF
jgi:hypothetical protein